MYTLYIIHTSYIVHYTYIDIYLHIYTYLPWERISWSLGLQGKPVSPSQTNGRS